MGSIESNNVLERVNSHTAEYLFVDESIFNITGYKVLLNQENNGFLKCTKVTYNGRIKLHYFFRGYKSLREISAVIAPTDFIRLVSNLLRVVNDINENGFMTSENIVCNPDRIYVNPKTLDVGLIYLPINPSSHSDQSFEKGLRACLLEIIDGMQTLMHPSINKLEHYLRRDLLSIAELYNMWKEESNSGNSMGATPGYMAGGGIPRGIPGNQALNYDMQAEVQSDVERTVAFSGQPKLIFYSNDAAKSIKFTIDKPVFTIGRDPKNADGVIYDNNKIGRIHCQIIYREGHYYLIDGNGTQNSLNHTWVNKLMLTNTNPFPIKNGDLIQLADSEFSVILLGGAL